MFQHSDIYPPKSRIKIRPQLPHFQALSLPCLPLLSAPFSFFSYLPSLSLIPFTIRVSPSLSCCPVKNGRGSFDLHN